MSAVNAVITTIEMPRWPVESVDAASSLAIRSAERRWAWRGCLASPLLAVLAWGLASHFLLFVLYLKPIAAEWDVIAALRWKPAWAVGLVTLLLPWCRWIGLRWSWPRPQFPWAVLLTLLLVVVVNCLLLHPRVNWFFVEWALVRTPNPSFSRNTLMWEQRNFEHSGDDQRSSPLVRLVGSSQIYHATNLTVLAEAAPEFRWEKNCLAGYGPIQYLWLEEVLLQPQPRCVVCWLSEFDFYREDELPLNRLRWASSPAGLQRLSTSLHEPFVNWGDRVPPLLAGNNWHGSPRDRWSLRGETADLGLAAAIPVWRLRDHVRRTVFHYWWDVSRPADVVTTDGPQLATIGNTQQAQDSLRANVGRKRFVETNFRAFGQFAADLRRANVSLVVYEGTTDPAATSVYDPQLRIETRARLQALSREHDFHYLDETALPAMTTADFADPYHLNPSARDRFSRFLAPSVRALLTRSP